MFFAEDLQALVSESQSEEHESIQLVALKVSSETDKQNSARVVLSVEGKEVVAPADTSGEILKPMLASLHQKFHAFYLPTL
jgi:2-isopropylmalate synthase